MTCSRIGAFGIAVFLATLLVWVVAPAPLVLAQEGGETTEGGGEQGGGEPEGPKIDWLAGPATGKLGDVAEVQVPEGFVFAGGDDTRTIMEAYGNPVNHRELGFLSPADHGWYVVFEWDACGFVKDDEKDSLDHKAMLESIIAGNERGNEERRKRGWATLTITGWQTPPRYNPETNNLEWGIQGHSDGSQVVNYSVRILGRSGVMQADLVVPPEGMEVASKAFTGILQGYAYASGNKYSEFKSGDKIAQYGLTALVTGTGIAVAAKTGLLQKLIKPILVGLAAVALAIKKFFSSLFGKKTAE